MSSHDILSGFLVGLTCSSSFFYTVGVWSPSVLNGLKTCSETCCMAPLAPAANL